VEKTPAENKRLGVKVKEKVEKKKNILKPQLKPGTGLKQVGK